MFNSLKIYSTLFMVIFAVNNSYSVEKSKRMIDTENSETVSYWREKYKASKGDKNAFSLGCYSLLLRRISLIVNDKYQDEADEKLVEFGGYVGLARIAIEECDSAFSRLGFFDPQIENVSNARESILYVAREANQDLLSRCSSSKCNEIRDALKEDKNP